MKKLMILCAVMILSSVLSMTVSAQSKGITVNSLGTFVYDSGESVELFIRVFPPKDSIQKFEMAINLCDSFYYTGPLYLDASEGDIRDIMSFEEFHSDFCEGIKKRYSDMQFAAEQKRLQQLAYKEMYERKN